MPFSNPEQTTTDLSTQIPLGWSMLGFSASASDGVNPYRVPQPVSEIWFSTPGPRYVSFTYQLYSPQQSVQASVALDGQPLGRYVFPAGQFVTVLPSGLVEAGQHVLHFEQGCASACPINQYYAGVKLIDAPPLRQSVGLGAVQWALDSAKSPFSSSGLSVVQFDGANLFRSLSDLQAATFTLPKGVQASDLRTFSVSDAGAYRLRWTSDGSQALSPRTERSTAFWPKSQLTEQSLPLIGRSTNGLSVQVECAAGGATCLPVRLYWTELTSLAPGPGLGQLSPLKLAGSVLLSLVLLAVFALLLRPERATR
ncbi:hypothetical protein GCM10022631_28140 [Deinococcus rubellus]|uniref:Ig-like domain-containing protein n=1 Tax=Deinococcus rubellus TaxID=1889240 RepID=A0ABY5YFS4_9DEIO|nr:hypothetical protein [Deinococcus rubellus]UWX63144.1 hypothetical protein N0D28_10295 [Deinococcus rubellus]